MVKVEESKTLNRKIRKDPWGEIGVSTLTKIKEAIQSGKSIEALDLTEYLAIEGKFIHDAYCDWIYHHLDYIAGKWGEEEMYRALRNAGLLFRKAAIEAIPLMSVEELVQTQAEIMRAHRCGPGELGNISVVEEKDRYVISFDPCGSGGRMRRMGEVDRIPPRTGPPFNLGKTKRAYPWSWGKVGVPYYCVHCCVWSEILPVELIGYPLRVCEYSDNSQDPCAWIYYKRPEWIPERYFTRIGKKKRIKEIRKA